MPINFPLGTFRNGRWVGFRLTTGRHYLVFTHDFAKRLESSSKMVYWRFMARQLRAIGLDYDTQSAWRAFAD